LDLSGLSPAFLWALGGLLLALAEFVVPGIFLIWVGAAALVTGLLCAVLPIPGFFAFGLFALLTPGAVVIGRIVYDDDASGGDPLLNDRAARLVGRVVRVIEPIEHGRGRVAVDDGAWPAAGADAAAGARVRIIGADGGLLIVEPAEG
jgi:inner membrane protein